MSLYRDIKFFNGSVIDTMGAIGTPTLATFSQKEKGYAIETSNGKYITYDKQLLPNSSFSVVIWVRVRNSNNFASDATALVSYGTGGYQGLQIGRFSQPCINLTDNTNLKIFSSPSGGLDKRWHCWVFTVPGSGQTDVANSNCYYDSFQLASSTVITTAPQTARSLFTYVGGGSSSTSGNHISRIRVYDTVLSQSEINAEQTLFMAASPLVKPKRGFAGALKATDLSQFKGSGAGQGMVWASNCMKKGSVFVDISGNGLNGTVTGGTSTLQGWKSNGVTDKVVLGNIGNVQSVSFRIKPSSSTIKILEGQAGSKSIYLNSGTLTASDFDNTYINGLSGSTMVANQWQTVTLTNSSNVAFTAATLGLNGSTYGAFEITDLRMWNRILSSQEIKSYANSWVSPYILEDFSSLPVDGSNIVPNGWIQGTGLVKSIQLTTDVVSGSVRIPKFQKILQCTQAGTIAIPSQMSSGVWEIDWLQGNSLNNLSINFIGVINTGNPSLFIGYDLLFNGSQAIVLRKRTPTGIGLISTANSYVSANTFYTIRIERTPAGQFTLLIKGGSFTPTAGRNGWTLVSTTGGSGSNPVTDTSYNTSNYMVLSMGLGDQIAGVRMWDGIKQL